MISGAEIEYQVTIGNNGEDPVSGSIPLNISIPEAFINPTFDSDDGIYNNTTKVFTLDSVLNAGESAVITVTATLSPDYEEEQISYSSTVTAPQGVYDPNLDNNTNTVTVSITKQINLGIDLSASTTTPIVGSNVIFTISATNYGPSKATGVEVTLSLPAAFEYQMDNGGGEYNSTTGVWSVGPLGVNETSELALVATMLSTGTHLLLAGISGNEASGGTHPDSDSIAITPEPQEAGEADLEIEMTVDEETPAIGSNVTFTLVATNNGPDAATGVMVVDLLPSGFTYVSDTGAGDYDSLTGFWTIGNLADEGTESLEIVATVNGEGVYANKAIISGNEDDPNLDNNEVTVTIVPEQGVIRGVGGRLLLADAYNNSPGGNPGVPYPTIVQMVKDCGFSMMRSSILCNADGTLTTARYNKLFGTGNQNSNGFVTQLRNEGLMLLPVIYDRLSGDPNSAVWDRTEQQTYDLAYIHGAGFETNYGHLFGTDYRELGNEQELFRAGGLVTVPPGNNPNNWKQPETAICVAYIAGLNDGVKSVNPNAKTIVNHSGAWKYPLFDWYVAAAPTIDIISPHWYNDAQVWFENNVDPGGDVIGWHYDRYSREVWISETNFRAKSSNSQLQNEEGQVEWHEEFIPYCLEHPHCGAVFTHELLDMRRNPAQSYEEEHFGLYKFIGYPEAGFTNPQPKLYAQSLLA